ncbi:MAG: DUF6036 family nucleotidyltransferase [Nanoarchaeota archaeon]
MIDIKQQEEILITIGNILEKKIVVYAIGGTAMMLKSIKDSTLDIDFVFNKKSDREEFIIALRKLGAKELDTTLVYGLKNNVPIILELSNARFDLFMNKVISSTFSEKMKNRAKQVHEFGKNLIIKVADSHDIIIMKSVTSRTKDLEDIATIIKKDKINWEIIIWEVKEQINLGNNLVGISLGEKLEKLNNQKAIPIPIPRNILDKLWKLLKGQIKKN